MAFTSGKKGSTIESREYSSPEKVSKSYLGKTIKIEGEITCDEFLTVEGSIKGNIKVSKTLTIGENGYVKGEIDAKDVEIVGKAEGKINASGKLEVSSKGNFMGSVKADKLVIEEGAVFKGKANMDDVPEKPSKPAKSSKAAAPEKSEPSKSEPPKSGPPE